MQQRRCNELIASNLNQTLTYSHTCLQSTAGGVLLPLAITTNHSYEYITGSAEKWRKVASHCAEEPTARRHATLAAHKRHAPCLS